MSRGGVSVGVGRWWVWGVRCGELGVGVMWGGMGVGWYGCGVVWVWGGMGVGWYGCGCREVGVGVGMENPTPVQNFTYLEPDSIISSLFSVIVCVVC